ncbi:MAG: glycosyltransferase family 39 protein [Ignavibacteria bacterium]|nr:glycosyltransferase family 39 protein [Ignavibacteria bacterium]
MSRMIASARRTGGLMLILAVSFGLRLTAIPVVHADGYYTGDEKEYVYLASSLADGGEFIDTNGEYSTRSPLYPFFLSTMVDAGSMGLLLSHIAGAVLGVIVVGLIYQLSMQLFGEKVWALAAAAVAGLYPGLIIYSALLQTEMLFLVFFLGSFLAGYRLLQKPTLAAGGVLGVLTGCAVLVRAVYLGFFPVFLGTLLFLGRKNMKAHILPIAASILVFAAVNMPWLVRNYTIHDVLVPVSLWGGRSILVANNPYATGTWSNHPGFESWFDQELSRRGIQKEGLTEYELSSVSREIGIDFLRENPGKGLSLAAARTHIFWIYPITNSDSNIPLQGIAVGADFFLMVLLLVGIAGFRKWDARLMPIWAAVAVFSLLHLVLHAEARYRLPIVPLLSLFAGIGIGHLMTGGGWKELMMRKEFRSRLFTGGAILAAVYGYTGFLFIEGRI